MKHTSIVSILVVASLTLLSACTTPGGNGGLTPQPPTIGDRMVNAQQWLNEPLTVYFSNHGTIPENANTVGQNDLFFQNPFAFQVQLTYQFPTNGFVLQNSTGNVLTQLPARANTQSAPIVDPANGKVIGYTWPSPSHMQPRIAVPKDEVSYSIELVNTCSGQIVNSSNKCSSPSAIMLLTISPPTTPAVPTNGQEFDFNLIEKGSGTHLTETKTTSIKAFFIQPNQCVIRNLFLQPSTGKAGNVGTVTFAADGCKRVQLSIGGQSNPLSDAVTTGTSGSVSNSLQFQIPKQISETATLNVWDAMQKKSTKTATMSIDPCSISPTHPQCPVNCPANPNDSRCAYDCTVHPNLPSCQAACPKTTDNPTGELKAWPTGEYCGTFQIIPVTIYGCTLDAAKQAYPPNYGCVYTTTSGTPVGNCPNGQPQQNFEFCLSCADTGGANQGFETVRASNACSLNDAEKAAISARLPRTCAFVSEGQCP